MTEKEFILQYVAVNLAGRAANNNLGYQKNSLNMTIKSAIKQAKWIYEEIPDELKESQTQK